MGSLVVFSRKLGFSHCPKRISSARRLDKDTPFPVFHIACIAPASSLVMENVFWKPSWSLLLVEMTS